MKAWGSGLGVQAKWPEEAEIIVNLVGSLRANRDRHGIGEEEAPPIRAVSIASGNPRKERQEGRREGILKQHGHVKTLPA